MFDFSAAREHMVESQIRTGDVTDPDVIKAFRSVARENFVPKSQTALAYSDTNIVSPDSRVIMKPRDIAKLVQAADIKPTDIILDIACGRGYSSAILARLGETVIALEDDDERVEKASGNLTKAAADNAVVVKGELKAGAKDHGPFNVIFVNGAVEEVPQNWLDQLANGGRLVAIVQNGRVGHACVFTRGGDSIGDRIVFDASAPVLEGTRKTKTFAF